MHCTSVLKTLGNILIAGLFIALFTHIFMPPHLFAANNESAATFAGELRIFDEMHFDRQTAYFLQAAAAIGLCVILLLALRASVLSRELAKKVKDLENARQALDDHLQKIRLTMEVTNAGSWEYYPQQGTELHSPQWHTMLGYPPLEQAPGPGGWQDLIHPEDREKTFQNFESYLYSKSSLMYEAEYRLRAADGSWRWVLGKGRVISRDAHGHPERFLGLNIDIHHIKTTQHEALRLNVLNKALLEQTNNFIGLVTLDGNITLTNRAFLRWSGHTEQELYGRPIWDGPWCPDAFAAQELFINAFAEIRAGRQLRREILLRAPSETLFNFDLTIAPFRNERGELSHCIVEGRDITELKKSQQAIIESERRFRSIFKNAPYSISIIDWNTGKILDANNTFLQKVSLRIHNYEHIYEEDIYALPKNRFKELKNILIQTNEAQDLEFSFLENTGMTRYDLCSASKINLNDRPCIIIISIDITERKYAIEALKRSEEMFSRLFHLSPDMNALTRLDDGLILEMNDAFTKFTGYSRKEALGKKVKELGFFSHKEMHKTFICELIQNNHVENYELDIAGRNGKIIQCTTSAKIIDIDGTPCVLSTSRDITQARAVQEVMVQSEKMLSLGGIAAGIAHEINNPLGIILQAAQTVSLRLQPDMPKNTHAAQHLGFDLHIFQDYLKARKIDIFLQDIEDAAARAADIIRHMLDFSRKSESKHSACDLRSVMESALFLASSDYDLKKKYDFRSIIITRNYAEDLPLFSGTETELEQVFLNLLRNAAQAIAEASPPVPSPEISISIFHNATHLLVEIGDNGPGISPEHRKRIFEPFFSTKPPGQGTGLGLSVSYFIVTKGHHGAMSISQPGRGGSVFHIEFPLARPQSPGKNLS